jgi:hypothetical protein
LPAPSSADTASATLLFKKSLRCIEAGSSPSLCEFAVYLALDIEVLSTSFFLYRLISFCPSAKDSRFLG